jgi:multicomponent Na+:H+ antiporter subunit G
MSDMITFAREIVAGLILAAACSIMLAGMIGMMRFPDFYTRLHAAAMAIGFGVGLACVALAIGSASFAAAIKLVLLGALIAALNPVLLHVSANTAHAGGLAPMTGTYVAPRPGARTTDQGPAA